MLSSSFRRVAWTPLAPISGISRSSTQTLSTSSNGLLGATQQVRQRRYSSSSSKPSDGSRRVETSSQAPAKGVNSGEKREGKASKRRGKDNGRNGPKSNQPSAFSNLPSVPSTQHLQPHDVHVASFFSIHRPISVSTTVPPTSTAEAFNAIFTAKKPSKQEADDVIFTLSAAADTMESSAHQLGEQDGGVLGNHFEMDHHSDSSLNLADLKVSVEELAKRFRPFNPPPAPVPFDEAKAAADADAAATAQSDEPASNSYSAVLTIHESTDAQSDEPASNSYSAVLTIHESTDAQGRKTYQAHTGPFVRSPDMDAPGAADESSAIIDAPHSNPGATYIERTRNNRTMHAISTRRRRMAKMKKHKFKKLLRRTRTLRRKLDKA